MNNKYFMRLGIPARFNRLLAFAVLFSGGITATATAQDRLEYIVDEETPSLCVVGIYLYGHCAMHREIARWNDIPPPYRIKLGQKLILEKVPELTPAEGRAKLLWAFRKKFGLPETGTVVSTPPPKKLEKLTYTEITKLAPPKPKALPSIEAQDELVNTVETPTQTQIQAERLRSTEEEFDFGVNLFNKKEFEDAVTAFRNARNQNPKFIPPWIFEIRSLKEIKKDDEARNTARELIEKHPHTARLPVVKTALEAGGTPPP